MNDMTRRDLTSYTHTTKLPASAKWERDSAYPYHDEADRLIFVVLRMLAYYTDGKPVRHEHTGKQLKKCIQSWRATPGNRKPPGARKLVYRLPELLREISADQNRTVYVVEGEPKVDLLRRWGFTATCAPEGAGKWYPEHAELLRVARRVVVLPDNDDEGRIHSDKVGRTLADMAAACHLLVLPDLPEHGDVVDWVRAGGTKEQFEQLAEAAPEWTAYKPPPESGRVEIESIEIRPGIVDIYNVRVRDCGVVAVGAEQLNYFPWFNRACITHLQRAFDPPRSPQAWSRQIDIALRAAKRIELPGETLRIHGTDSWVEEEVEWTVYDRVPRCGVGLLVGQYGVFKTFVLLDLCGSVMVEVPFLDRQVRRRCGVLIFAAEGARTIPLRLRAMVEHKLTAYTGQRRDLLNPEGLDLGYLPFSFVGNCRPLLDPRTVDWMVEQARLAHAYCKATHGIDLGIIAIDTMAAAAGWDNENDAAQAQIVMNHLADVSQATDTFVLAVDHFGLDISRGSRGSSAKELAADMIFYLRGKEEENGTFTDTRLVLRKQRGGLQGMMFPFAARLVDMGNDKLGDPLTSRIIDWNVTRPEQQKPKPKVQVMLEEVLADALAEHGETVKANGADGVRAVRKDKVRSAFQTAYKEEHPDSNSEAVGQAWRRALDQATKDKAAEGGTVNGVAYLWQPAMPF